jgi:uncharacterized membrane protein
MRILYLTCVSLHVIAAMIWIGGSWFIALSLVPAVRRSESPHAARGLLHATVLRFRIIGWSCLGILVATGCGNLAFRGIGWMECVSGAAFRGPVGRALAMKLILVGAVLILSAWHDFRLGPATARAIERDPASIEAARGRARAAWIGRVTALLGLGVVICAVVFVRGGFF